MSYLGVQYSAARQPHTEFPDRLVAMLRKKFVISPRSMVLDVGCGRGDFLQAWRRAGFYARGADRDPVLEGVFRTDITKDPLPFPPHSFDLVFSKSLIEHLADPSNFLAQSWRVLRPGGLLLVLAPDWRTYMRTFYDDYTHVRPYDQVSLADLIAARGGFADVRCERIYQYPPIWRCPPLAVPAALWRWLVPTEASLTLSRRSGIGFFRWASQLTLLASATRVG